MTVTDYRENTRRANDPARLRRFIWGLWWVTVGMIVGVGAWGLLGARTGFPWWMFIGAPLFVLGRISWVLYRTRPNRISADATDDAGR